MENLAIFLIKPDAIIQGIDNKIIKLITKYHLAVISRKMIRLDEQEVRTLQPVLNMPSEYGEGWKNEVIKFMTSRPVCIILAQGNDALSVSNVIKKNLRKKYIPKSVPDLHKIIYNLLHTASSKEDLCLNLTVLFPELKEG